jgi:hypothetical protein
VEKPKAIREAVKLAWKALKREQRAGAKLRNPERIAEAAGRAEAIIATIKDLAARLSALKSTAPGDEHNKPS